MTVYLSSQVLTYFSTIIARWHYICYTKNQGGRRKDENQDGTRLEGQVDHRHKKVAGNERYPLRQLQVELARGLP
jgi:hypothetical protein